MPLPKKYIKTKKFLPLVLDEASPLLAKEIEENKEKMGQKMSDLLWGRKSAKYRIGKEDKKLDFLGMLVDYYSELTDSLENMKLSAILINQYPYKKTLEKNKFNKAKYLSYHIGAYLNEVYLFRERMKRFLEWLEKEFKKLNLDSEAEIVKKHRFLIDLSLKAINENRRSHVHTKRFEDLSLEQLNYIYLLMTNDKQDNDKIDFFNNVAVIEKLTYGKARREWSNRISKNNEGIEKAMEVILEDIKYPIFKYLYPGKKIHIDK